MWLDFSSLSLSFTDQNFFINLDWFCSMDTTHPCTTHGCGINQQWPFKGNHLGTQLKLVLAFLGGCFQMSTGCAVTE
jgi:hypothetical protein